MTVRSSFFIGLACVSLAACDWPASLLPSSASTSSSSEQSSSVRAKQVQYEGLLQKTGVDSVIGGTHFLVFDGGGLIALTDDGADLDMYVDTRVRVGGLESISQKGYPIVSVTAVQVIDQELPDLGESSSSSFVSSAVSSAFSSSEAASSSAESSSLAASSAIASSKPAPASSSRAPASSSARAMSSLPPVVSSSSVSGADSSVKTAAMAKASVSDATFTQSYCSQTAGFCVPVHKNWYYTSFGGQTSARWYVEFGPQAIEAIGDGVINLQLVDGALELPDNTVSEGGAGVIGYRAWTGGRHFEIRGPVTLKSAVEYMTKSITTAEVTQ